MNPGELCALFAAALGAIALSCRGAPTSAPPVSRAALTISPEQADVWAWDAEVRGAIVPPIALVRCRIVVDGRASPAAACGDAYRARVHLGAGRNEVRAVCIDVRGAEHASAVARLEAMLRDGPTARVRAAIAGDQVELDARESTPSQGTPSPIVSFAWTGSPGGAAGEGSAWRAPMPRVEGARVVLRVTARDALARTDAAAVEVVVESGHPRVVDASGDGGPDAARAIVYGAVPPLFGAPPLRATTAALADLAELGVTTLWLSPIFETLPGEYGYAVTDYLRVRADYGTEDDLRALVAEAHRLGLRVVLDLVPNHTAAEHRYFQDARAHGRASHYFDFYERDARGEPVHYFDWEGLSNLDYGTPEVSRWMLAVADRWMRDVGVDGWRIDAAWGPRQRTPTFFAAFRAEVRRTHPDALLVAEASARDPYWRAQGFDAAYDWTDELGKPAWEHAFDDGAAAPDRLDAAARGARSRPLLFLENNDTGARFVTRHGAGMTRVAAAALFTLPGIPALFTGQERGAEYEPYARAESFDPLPPGDPHGLRPWYAALVALRRRTPALRDGDYVRAKVEGAAAVLAFSRHDDATGDDALVVLHFAGGRARVRVIPPRPAARWRTLLGGEGADGSLAIDLGPWDARVFAPARE